MSRSRACALAVAISACVLSVLLGDYPAEGDRASPQEHEPSGALPLRAIVAQPSRSRIAHEHVGSVLRKLEQVAAELPAEAPPAPADTALPDVYRAIDELEPLLDECYELGRQEQPDLHEALAVVDLSISPDGLGDAVIEQSHIADESENLTPAFSECVRETMYRAKLTAPATMGQVSIVHTIRFGREHAEL